MGASTQTSTEQQHSVTQPWAPAIPGLQQILGDSSALYGSGVGSGVYSGPRVADFNTDTNMGINRTRDTALSDDAGSIGTNALQGIVGSNGGVSYNGPSLDANGLSAGTVGALSNLSNVKGVDLSRLTALGDSLADPNNPVNQTANAFMSGSRDLTTIPQLQDLYARSQAPSAAETNLSKTAAGDYLDPTTNPWVSKLADVSATNAANAAKASFATSGRYGSGAFSGAVAKAVNDTQSGLFADQYNRERANQFSANSMIDSARQTGTQLGASITGQIGNVESTNNSQRLSGAGLAQAQTAQRAGVEGQILGGNEFNSNLDYQKAATALGTMRQGTSDAMQNESSRVGTALQSQGQALQAAGLLPAMSALRYSGGNALMGIGGAQQAQNQAGLDANQDLFNEEQAAPWNEIGRYAGLVGGIGGMGGTTDGTSKKTQRTDPGTLNSILGAGSSIAGMGANLGKAVPFFTMLGSDERLKENIEEVGRLHDGQPIYRFRYRGDPRMQIGLMAQEVMRIVPDAVAPMPGMGGMLGVDYGRATERAAAMAARG